MRMNELLQLLNQFFASKFAAPQAQPFQPFRKNSTTYSNAK